LTVEPGGRFNRWIDEHRGSIVRERYKMAKQIPKVKRRAPKASRAGMRIEDSVPFSRKNYVLFAAGILTILLGFLFLSQNSITLAPLLLVAGYCVIIPLAIALK